MQQSVCQKDFVVWLKSSVMSPADIEKQRILPSHFRVLQVNSKAVRCLIPVSIVDQEGNLTLLSVMAEIKRA